MVNAIDAGAPDERRHRDEFGKRGRGPWPALMAVATLALIGASLLPASVSAAPTPPNRLVAVSTPTPTPGVLFGLDNTR